MIQYKMMYPIRSVLDFRLTMYKEAMTIFKDVLLQPPMNSFESPFDKSIKLPVL